MRATTNCFCMALALTILTPISSSARTIRVPSGYPSIQAAINASSSGDEIIVSPGRYKENIRFLGKNIRLQSTAPTSRATVAATIIDGRSSASVVAFAGSETPACLLSGFTIIKGKTSSGGGGVKGNGARATISSNIITSNTASSSDYACGGGIYNCDGLIEKNIIADNFSDYGAGLAYCDGIVRSNTISANFSGSHGAGAYKCNAAFTSNTIEKNHTYSNGGAFAQCSGLVENNVIRSNFAKYGGGLYYCSGKIRRNLIVANGAGDVGGGILGSSGVVEQNIITSNSASFWGGGIAGTNGPIRNNLIVGNKVMDEGAALFGCSGPIQNNTICRNKLTGLGPGDALARCSGEIRNCIIWGNTSSKNIHLSSCSLPSYCDIQNWTSGGQGNLSIDPLFVKSSAGDFRLTAASPCIDAGSSISSIKNDLDNNPRPVNGTPIPRGDGSDYDIGAYEFLPRPLLSTYWSYYN